MKTVKDYAPKTQLFGRIEPKYDIEIHSYTPFPKRFTRTVALLQTTVNGEYGFLFLRHVSQLSGAKLAFHEQSQPPKSEIAALDAVEKYVRRWLFDLPHRTFEALPVADTGEEAEYLCPFCGQTDHRHGVTSDGYDAGGFCRRPPCHLFPGATREYRISPPEPATFERNLGLRWTFFRAHGRIVRAYLPEPVASHLRDTRRAIDTDWLSQQEPFRSLKGVRA